jgi:glycosyltransferase involved in cell wall biosynthesis
MILGRCDEKLEAALESAMEFGDEICIVQTVEDEATTKIVNDTLSGFNHKYAIRPDLMNEDGFLNSFSEARNESFALATGEWILWLDSDDTINNPIGLKEFVNNVESYGYEGAKVDMIRLEYDYEHDQDGNCTTRHTRERIVRSGYFKWIAPIHEVLSPIKVANAINLERSVSYIKHNNVINEDNTSREERNVVMLERIVNSDECDARMKMYYANSLAATGNPEQAAFYYQEYLNESTWDEERYQVMLRLCDLYKTAKEYDHAGTWAAEATRLLPALREAYLALAEVSALQDDWDGVCEWVDVFGSKESGCKSMIHNPTAMAAKPWILLQQAYWKKAEFQKAQMATESLLDILPGKKDQLVAFHNSCTKQIEDLKLIDAYKRILDNVTEESKEYVYKTIPESISDYPEFQRNKKKFRPEGRKVCAIYCGYDETRAWGPESIKEGIGGSEEAVINVSKELTRLGWHVEVYANVSTEGQDPDTGVMWYNAMAANPKDLVDLCILWRHPHHVYAAPQGTITWLWNHDLQNNMEPYYDDATMQKIDTVLFLSKFHRETAPWVDEEKVFYTTNGVDPDLMVTGNNDANSVVFASSPDRGLDTLLEVWPEVVKNKPDAHLKVFYGFNEWFDQRYKSDKKMMEWKNNILETMEADPSITYYGSVGQDVLAEHLSTCGVWAYPTAFGEISCITAMKMQCAGVIPVTSRYAALDETVQHGVKLGEYEQPVLDITEYTNALVDMVGDEERQNVIRKKMKSWAKNSFRWDFVAKHWQIRHHNDYANKFRKKKVTHGGV